jgi:Family of unknown function (DUF5988)
MVWQNIPFSDQPPVAIERSGEAAMDPLQANTVLVGGPANDLPFDQRLRRVDDAGETVKVPGGNRYDHYRPTGEVHIHDGRQLRVYVWAHRTYVAE